MSDIISAKDMHLNENQAPWKSRIDVFQGEPVDNSF